MTPTDLLKSAPKSPIPIYATINHTNRLAYDEGMMANAVWVCNATSFALRDPKGAGNAKRLADTAGVERVGCYAMYGKDWDFATGDTTLLSLRLAQARDSLGSQPWLCHYEFERDRSGLNRTPTVGEWGRVFDVAKSQCPNMANEIYNLPGWHATEGGCGYSRNAYLGAIADRSSCTVYGTTAEMALQIMLRSLVCSDGMPGYVENGCGALIPRTLPKSGEIYVCPLTVHIKPHSWKPDDIDAIAAQIIMLWRRGHLSELHLYPGFCDDGPDANEFLVPPLVELVRCLAEKAK